MHKAAALGNAGALYTWGGGDSLSKVLELCSKTYLTWYTSEFARVNLDVIIADLYIYVMYKEYQDIRVNVCVLINATERNLLYRRTQHQQLLPDEVSRSSSGGEAIRGRLRASPVSKLVECWPRDLRNAKVLMEICEIEASKYFINVM